MRAAALTTPEHIGIIDVPEPSCGPQDVLVRMLGVGLCGTDTAVVRGSRPVPRLPWVLGHEGVGEIVSVGECVQHRRAGQRVAIEPNYHCRRCEQCQKGLTSACRARAAVGITEPGVLAEHVAVPATFAHPVAEEVSLADLVCIEPLTVARAAVRRAAVTCEERCLVVGAGSQGLFVCLSLLEADVTPLVQEPHAGRRDLALSLGAVPAQPDQEVDHVFETSGAPGALEQASETVVPGGQAVLVGMHPAPLTLTPHTIVSRQLRITGSLIYDHPRDFTDTIERVQQGTLAPRQVLQGQFAFDTAAEAFAAVPTTPGKCWITLQPDQR